MIYATLAQLVEQQFCKLWVVSSNLTGGSVFYGQMAEWSIATDCKSVALAATQVRILLCPMFV